MPAPKGNKYYMNVLMKTGRKKEFSDPEEFAQRIADYFDHVDKNPYLKPELIRTGERTGEVCYIEIPEPYLIEDLCVFMGISRPTFHAYGNKPANKEFFSAYNSAIDIINGQKKKGALLGYYNASVATRILGLGDKQDITSGGEKVQNVINLGNIEI